MACFKIIAAGLLVMTMSGCTATPERDKRMLKLLEPSAVSADSSSNAKVRAVANAAIGVPQVYIDPKLGDSVEFVVQSEYFSANGRTCRRYAEYVDGKSVPGISCKDDVSGWVDISLSAFIR